MVAMPTDPARVELRRAEVIRLLERYLVEVVERWNLCPWARSAREGGEVAIEVVWGTPTAAALGVVAAGLLARPGTAVAMVVVPELAVSPRELRELRAEVAPVVPQAGVADFHPEAPLDLGTPARLVPFVRRSPDPLLQFVPFALMKNVRAPTPVVDLTFQAQLLGGLDLPVLREDVGDLIAEDNHRVVSAALVEVTAVLEDIARDRASAYARVGVSSSRSP